MQFKTEKSLEVLRNTPEVLSALLNNLSEEWINCNEGDDTWSPKEVIAHLIVCEETDWLSRVKIILSDLPVKVFQPVDMQAHFKMADNFSIGQLLIRFRQLREYSLSELIRLEINSADLHSAAMHPVLGTVTLQELLATWVTHDLTHTAQITRVLAKQNKPYVGGFIQFLSIIK